MQCIRSSSSSSSVAGTIVAIAPGGTEGGLAETNAGVGKLRQHSLQEECLCHIYSQEDSVIRSPWVKHPRKKKTSVIKLSFKGNLFVFGMALLYLGHMAP